MRSETARPAPATRVSANQGPPRSSHYFYFSCRPMLQCADDLFLDPRRGAARIVRIANGPADDQIIRARANRFRRCQRSLVVVGGDAAGPDSGRDDQKLGKSPAQLVNR